MTTISLADVGSGFKRTAINTNFDAIEAAINNDLLDKAGGKALEADLDYNSKKAINMADGINNTDGATVAQLNTAISGSASGLIASQIESQLGSDVSTLVTTFTGITYVVGANNLEVYRNGNRQTKTRDYTETSTSSITWVSAPNATDNLEFRTNTATTNSTTTTAAITHTEDGDTYNLGTYLQNRHVLNVRDFGAVGDGLTDDTAAIVAALAAAPDSDTTVVGNGGDDYLFTSTLSLSGKRVDGRGCRFIKDFDGIGIDVTGGSLFTYISNLRIDPSATYQPSDYNASGVAHGVRVTGTRVEASNITSNNHDGAGFYLDNTTGNMNKSKYLNIKGGKNSLAGCYMTGNYPTVNDMSVWEFNGQFNTNWGRGFVITDTCSIRQSNFWLYTESNMLGASFPSSGEFDVDISRAGTCIMWIYSEHQETSNSEIKLGANTDRCIINSARKSADEDSGSNNTWVAGNQHYTPSTSAARSATPLQITANLARVTTSGEYSQAEFTGSGGTFGFIRGEGNGAGDPYVKIVSDDELTELQFTTNVLTYRPNGVNKFRIDDDTVTAGDTALLLWDVDNGVMERVTVGAADSGGSGYKVLRILN